VRVPPSRALAAASRRHTRLGLVMERGREGLGLGASPPGAAPSDRLAPPPPPPPPGAPSAAGSSSLRGAMAPAFGLPPRVLSSFLRNKPANPPPNSPAAAPAPVPAPLRNPQAPQPWRWRRQAASQGDRPEQSSAESAAACAIEQRRGGGAATRQEQSSAELSIWPGHAYRLAEHRLSLPIPSSNSFGEAARKRDAGNLKRTRSFPFFSPLSCIFLHRDWKERWEGELVVGLGLWGLCRLRVLRRVRAEAGLVIGLE
jgi:hypothetical protein